MTFWDTVYVVYAGFLASLCIGWVVAELVRLYRFAKGLQ